MTTKPIKARRMWADSDPKFTHGLRLQVYGSRRDQRGSRPDLKPTPVAVLDVSDEAALIEQARKVIIDVIDVGDDMDDGINGPLSYHTASAVLTSLGIIRPQGKVKK